MFGRHSNDDYDYPTPGRKPRPWFDELDSQPASSSDQLQALKQASPNPHQILVDQSAEAIGKDSPMRFGLQQETWTMQNPFGHVLGRSCADYDSPAPARKPGLWLSDLGSKSPSTPSSIRAQQAVTPNKSSLQQQTVHSQQPAFGESPALSNHAEADQQSVDEPPAKRLACTISKKSPDHERQEEVWTPPQRKSPGQLVGCLHEKDDYPTPGRKPHPWFDELDSQPSPNHTFTKLQEAATPHSGTAQIEAITQQPSVLMQQTSGCTNQAASAKVKAGFEALVDIEKPVNTTSTGTQTDFNLYNTEDSLKQVFRRIGFLKHVLEFLLFIGLMWLMVRNVQEKEIAHLPALSPNMAEAFIDFHKCHDWIDESWQARRLPQSWKTTEEKISSQEVLASFHQGVETPPQEIIDFRNLLDITVSPLVGALKVLECLASCLILVALIAR